MIFLDVNLQIMNFVLPNASTESSEIQFEKLNVILRTNVICCVLLYRFCTAFFFGHLFYLSNITYHCGNIKLYFSLAPPFIFVADKEKGGNQVRRSKFDNSFSGTIKTLGFFIFFLSLKKLILLSLI